MLNLEHEKQTGWPFYNGDKGISNQDRLAAYQAWCNGTSPIMICTNAFSTGNNYGHVQLMVHAKMALEMSELIQAQGQVGRDGRTTKCVIMPATTGAKPKIGKDQVNHKGLWAAYKHAYEHGEGRCLWYGTTSYVDGRGVECKENDANVTCSACKKQRAGEVMTWMKK